GAGYTTAAGGVLTLETNGAFAYQPPIGNVPPAGVTETFNYMITDEDGDTSSAVLTVEISYQGQPYSIAVSHPVRVTIAPTGQILVSSYNTGRVQIFNPETVQLEGLIEANRKITAVGAASDRVLVGLDVPGAVAVYSYAGELLTLLGAGVEEFDSPSDLAIDASNGRVYVVDSRKKEVRVYALDDGTFLSNFGQDRMKFPTGIAIDPGSNTLLISDFAVGRSKKGTGMMSPTTYDAGIWRYDLDGNYIETITGSFSRPQGLAVNGNGEIFLADSLIGEILVFRKNPDTGNYEQPYNYGGEEMPLRLPLDVAINQATRDLYLTNNLLDRVEVIPAGGNLP
ncbi:MAG: NHL repeat-containing protein, partial [Desulfuromonadales bacterium]|nr:NHL repeat-containing protein [Desulfuromonadales bacterium]